MTTSSSVQRHMAAGGGTMLAVLCENCARPDEDLALVHRLYVVPEAWDTARAFTRMADRELWCFSCRSQYPHEDADRQGRRPGD